MTGTLRRRERECVTSLKPTRRPLAHSPSRGPGRRRGAGPWSRRVARGRGPEWGSSAPRAPAKERAAGAAPLPGTTSTRTMSVWRPRACTSSTRPASVAVPCARRRRAGSTESSAGARGASSRSLYSATVTDSAGPSRLSREWIGAVSSPARATPRGACSPRCPRRCAGRGRRSRPRPRRRVRRRPRREPAHVTGAGHPTDVGATRWRGRVVSNPSTVSEPRGAEWVRPGRGEDVEPRGDVGRGDGPGAARGPGPAARRARVGRRPVRGGSRGNQARGAFVRRRTSGRARGRGHSVERRTKGRRDESSAPEPGRPLRRDHA